MKDIEEQDLSKLSNQQIRETLININKVQLYRIGALSIYDLIYRCSKLKSSLIKDNFIEKLKSEREKKEILHNFNYIFNIISNIDDIFEYEDNVEKEIKILKYTRKDVQNIFNSLQPYISEISYTEEICDYILTKKVSKGKYKDFYINNKILHNFYMDLSKYLLKDNKNYYLFNNKVSSIINLLPFRLTKDKFFELIKNALKRNLQNSPKILVEFQIKEYKLLFNGSMDINYGIKFDEYFTKIQNLKYKNIKLCTEDELKEIISECEQIICDIDKVGSFIKQLGIIINKLIVVHMTKQFINQEIKNDKILLEWKKYIECLDDKNFEELQKIIKDKMNILQKDMYSDNIYLQKLSKEGAKRENILDEELTNKLLYTRHILIYFNDLQFEREEILFADIKNLIDEDYLDQILNNFIQFINRNISSMNNIERKIKMRRFLSSVEFPFDRAEKFMKYVELSLDPRVTSREEIIATLNKIYHLFKVGY